MIAVPPGVRILLATRPVDFRKGMDGLAALVQQTLRTLNVQPDLDVKTQIIAKDVPAVEESF